MTEINILVDWIQSIGFVGLLTLLALPKTRKFLGFGNGENHNEEHDKIWQELATIRDNHLVHIKDCLTQVKTDVAWLRGKLDN